MCTYASTVLTEVDVDFFVLVFKAGAEDDGSSELDGSSEEDGTGHSSEVGSELDSGSEVVSQP
jgi:hypothetical protein